MMILDQMRNHKSGAPITLRENDEMKVRLMNVGTSLFLTLVQKDRNVYTKLFKIKYGKIINIERWDYRTGIPSDTYIIQEHGLQNHEMRYNEIIDSVNHHTHIMCSEDLISDT